MWCDEAQSLIRQCPWCEFADEMPTFLAFGPKEFENLDKRRHDRYVEHVNTTCPLLQAEGA